MAKSLLYRLVGIGGLPKNVRASLESEGVRIIEEGIRVSVNYRDFKAPGKRFTWKRRGWSGSISITSKRLIAYAGFVRLVNVAFDDPQFRKLDIVLEPPGCLCISFDPSDFNPNQAGRIECRFFTSQAENFAGWLKQSLSSL